jgi:hypothetical protein
VPAPGVGEEFVQSGLFVAPSVEHRATLTG